MLEPFWSHFEVQNLYFFVAGFLIRFLMVWESILGRFGSQNEVIFELEIGFRDEVSIFKNIGFTSVKHRFLRFWGVQNLRKSDLRAMQKTSCFSEGSWVTFWALLGSQSRHFGITICIIFDMIFELEKVWKTDPPRVCTFGSRGGGGTPYQWSIHNHIIQLSRFFPLTNSHMGASSARGRIYGACGDNRPRAPIILKRVHIKIKKIRISIYYYY
jgi:hypothetical protein